MIEVRLLRAGEYEEAGRITASAWSHIPPNAALADFLGRVSDVAGRAQTASVFVGTIEGQIAGTVTLELETRVFDPDNPDPLRGGECHVRMLGVDPTRRRLGVANELMKHCVEVAREADKSVMTLNTSEQNIAAQRFYESIGFQRGDDVVRPDGSRLRTYRYDLSISSSAVSGEGAA